jgi:hypothetical protein
LTACKSNHLHEMILSDFLIKILEYSELHEFWRKKDRPVPPELLNYMAVLFHLEAVGIEDYFDGKQNPLLNSLLKRLLKVA